MSKTYHQTPQEYLADIGRRGGKAGTAAQRAARTETIKLARAVRADKFRRRKGAEELPSV